MQSAVNVDKHIGRDAAGFSKPGGLLSSNVVDIICPLVVIGLTDLANSR